MTYIDRQTMPLEIVKSELGSVDPARTPTFAKLVMWEALQHITELERIVADYNAALAA